jgi:hypothetical protein
VIHTPMFPRERGRATFFTRLEARRPRTPKLSLKLNDSFGAMRWGGRPASMQLQHPKRQGKQ